MQLLHFSCSASGSVVFFEYTSTELKGDFEIMIEAVSKEPDSLKYASSELQNNKDIVTAALRGKGCALNRSSLPLLPRIAEHTRPVEPPP